MSLDLPKSQPLLARVFNALVRLLWVMYNWTVGWLLKIYPILTRKCVCPIPNCKSRMHRNLSNNRVDRPGTLGDNSDDPAQPDKGRRRFHCPIPNCDKSRGRGFSMPIHVTNHMKGHEGGEHHCLEPGCRDNNGMGFSTEPLRKKHVNLEHSAKRYHCKADGCDDNGKRGYKNSQILKEHTRSVHAGGRPC
jgi:hypothetical protein